MVKHLVKVQYAVLISSIFILSHVYLLDITQLLNKKLVAIFPLPASALCYNSECKTLEKISPVMVLCSVSLNMLQTVLRSNSLPFGLKLNLL